MKTNGIRNDRIEPWVVSCFPVHSLPPPGDQQTCRVDMKYVGPRFCAVGVGFEVISIGIHMLCARLFNLRADSLSDLAVMLTLWCGCDVDWYTRVHGTRLLMKTINCKHENPEEFLESLREEFRLSSPTEPCFRFTHVPCSHHYHPNSSILPSLASFVLASAILPTRLFLGSCGQHASVPPLTDRDGRALCLAKAQTLIG